MIEDNLTSISNAMFRYRNQWPEVTNDLKEKWFFIINRYLSKVYPKEAFYLNDKSIDKISAMNTWYAFMLNKPFPKEMWSKPSEKKVKKDLFSQKDLLSLQRYLQITQSELELLVKYHEEDLKEELKYLKNTENE